MGNQRLDFCERRIGFRLPAKGLNVVINLYMAVVSQTIHRTFRFKDDYLTFKRSQLAKDAAGKVCSIAKDAIQNQWGIQFPLFSYDQQSHKADQRAFTGSLEE
jgi:hypothetical protein